MLSWYLLGNSQDCIPHFHILHQPVGACLHGLQSQWLTFTDSLNFHVGMGKQWERERKGNSRSYTPVDLGWEIHFLYVTSQVRKHVHTP